MHKIIKMLAVCAPLFVSASATAQDSVDASQEAVPGTADGAVVGTENAGTADASGNAVADSSDGSGDIYDEIFGGSSKPATDAAPVADASGESGAAPVAESGDTANAGASAETGEGGASGVSPEGAIMTAARLDKQLREVSTNLDTLKEDTFATKSRLLLLREEVLQRAVSGARIQLRYEDDMGGQYDLTQVYYAIDRETVFSGTGESLKKLDGELIYDRMLAPGAHQLTVVYVYKGRPWGVFRYMTDYTFRVESGYDFVVDEGKSAELVVVATEQGDAFTAYEERPDIKFKYQQYDLVAGSKENQ